MRTWIIDVMRGKVVSSLELRMYEMMNYHGFEKHHYLERYEIILIQDTYAPIIICFAANLSLLP
jgi:hypothetical protein